MREAMPTSSTTRKPIVSAWRAALSSVKRAESGRSFGRSGLRLREGFEHPPHQQRVLPIQTIGERMPVALAGPDPPRRGRDPPTVRFKRRQARLGRRLCLRVAPRRGSDGGNEAAELLIDAVAMAGKLGVGLPLA